MKKTYILNHAEARRRAIQAIQEAPDGFAVTISEPNRSLDQNAAQWPILHAFSAQLKWPVNGRMVTMSPNDWKTVLSAAFKREAIQIANGLDGGTVMLGMRTSKMSKSEFSEWLDFLNATATMKGVVIYSHENEKESTS